MTPEDVRTAATKPALHSTPQPAAGGGVGVPLGVILVYVLERIPAVGDIPGPIEAAIIAVVAAALAFAGGYFRSDRR